MSIKRLKANILIDPQARIEYEKLESEFQLMDMLIRMRTESGLTQTEIAEKMKTQKSNISRLEQGKSNPSWATLTKYALACGYR